MTSQHEPAPLPDSRVTVGGRDYVTDGKGRLQPIETVGAADLLEDETVRRVVGYGLALSEQVARFKGHTFEDLGEFEALLAQDYGVKKRGAKGNRTFMTYDGLHKVEVRVADYVDFGPQLEIAKDLIDECLNEWSADAQPELRAIVTRAFNTDKKGQINRSEIFMLLRLEIDDPRWKKAMEAIRDAMRVVGQKTYIRLFRRSEPGAPWQPVTIDLAKA